MSASVGGHHDPVVGHVQKRFGGRRRHSVNEWVIQFAREVRKARGIENHGGPISSPE